MSQEPLEGTNDLIHMKSSGFPGDSDSKESACNTGDWGSTPGLGRYPGEENGNPLQYSFFFFFFTQQKHFIAHHNSFVSSKTQNEVAQSCPTLCDPMDCTLPGSSIHGIFQARILEWVAISFSIASILAWRIPWTELQFRGSQRIGHD